MNKWQIICPLTAMALFVLLGGFLMVRSFNRQVYRDTAWNIAHELITTTNSQRLTSMSPALQNSLTRFLASPAKVESAQSQVIESDGSKTQGVVVCCTNQSGERISLTLGWEPESRKFSVVSYSYPAPPPSSKSSRPH